MPLLAEMVREGMHAVAGGGDVLDVGEDIVRREGYELAATPKDMAEEVVGIESVGEVGEKSSRGRTSVGMRLLQSEPNGRARWEVAKAGTEDRGQIPRTPPPRDCPDAECRLHDDSGGILPLRDSGWIAERGHVELHL